MDIILLGITVVSLIVALVMSVTAWRLMRADKQRTAARVAALSLAANEPMSVNRSGGLTQSAAALEEFADEKTVKPVMRAPWASPFDSPTSARAEVASLKTAGEQHGPPELRLNHEAGNSFDLPKAASSPIETPVVTHSSGFLGASELPRDNGGRQKSLAFAAMFLFAILCGGLFWMMSGPEGTSAAAVGPNSPLELVSLTSSRQNDKLAVSGLVRNPVNGKPVERLSAVVFLFDRTGTFITSSRANVDFLKIGAGDESPFVVSLDAPQTVARYRVSFRTDDGIVPHVDRRSASPAVEGEQAVNAVAK
jgi:hypothetical protein